MSTITSINDRENGTMVGTEKYFSKRNLQAGLALLRRCELTVKEKNYGSVVIIKCLRECHHCIICVGF